MEKETNKIKGGKADNLTLVDIAKKHGVKLIDIIKEVQTGLKVEAEHTDDEEKQLEIVMDHLYEFHDYYTNKEHGLKAMEKQLEKQKDLKESLKHRLRELLLDK